MDFEIKKKQTKRSTSSEVTSTTIMLSLTYLSHDFFWYSEKDNRIGNGSFAKVLRFYHKEWKYVAIKICQLTGSVDGVESKKKDGFKEARRFLNLNHKHIVKFFGIVEEENHFGIILKMVHGGNLEDLMRTNKDDFSWTIRLKILTQISDALNYLHTHADKPLIHGDLKPQNILLTRRYNVRLGDLGSIIAEVSRGTTQPSTQHTLEYTPPERLKDLTEASYYTDIYSFAIITYEMTTWQKAFQGDRLSTSLLSWLKKYNGQEPNSKLFDETERKLKDESKPIFFKLKSLAIKCWDITPSKRPKAIEVYEDLQSFARKEKIVFSSQKKPKRPLYDMSLPQRTLHDYFTYGQMHIAKEFADDDVFADEGKVFILKKKTILKYDIAAKQLVKEKLELDQEDKEGALVRMKDHIYFISSKDPENFKRISFQDPKASWQKMPKVEKVFALHASAVLHDEIYVVGGSKENKAIPEKKFNPATKQWNKIREMRTLRHGHALVAMDDFLYAVGGFEDKSMEIYNVEDNFWRQTKALMRYGRYGLAAVALNGKLYAIGGHDNEINAVLNSVEVYDPKTDRWSETGSLKVARCWHGACVSGGKIYVFGGETDIIEVFDPKKEQWDVETQNSELNGVRSVVSV